MKQQAYIIIDIGTGNSRVAVVSSDGEILALTRENSVMHTDHRVRGAQYFEPKEWEEILFRLIAQSREKAGDVDIVAVSAGTLRQGIVLLDENGEPLIGYSNADRRGEPYMQQLDWQRIGEVTGLSPSPIFSGIKMLGAMQLDPELVERTKQYTSISDWVGHLFTGRCVWERAQAMQSALYDAVRGDWSQELANLIGVDLSKLPPLADAGTVLGRVYPALCERFGLNPQAVFVTGTADTQAALTAVNAELGETLIVSGTTSPSVKVIPEFHSYPLTWVSPTAERGRYMLEVNPASSGINLQRFKDLMLPDYPYDKLNRDAVERGMPEAGLPACMAVFCYGMHLDQSAPNGGFVMRNPVSIDLKQSDFFHALALNIGMSITMCLRRLDSLSHLERDYLIGCGGGFVSPIIGQTVSDLTGMPIRVYDNYREATVYGCYTLCRRALGLGDAPRRLLREITPHKSNALEDYFAQWKTYREHFNTFNF